MCTYVTFSGGTQWGDGDLISFQTDQGLKTTRKPLLGGCCCCQLFVVSGWNLQLFVVFGFRIGTLKGGCASWPRGIVP